MKKLSYNHIKKQIENRGYTLLSESYEGYYHKLDIVCVKGHKYRTSWNVLRMGSECPICYREKQSESMLKKFDVIKNFVNQEGFILLANKLDYKGNYSKLKAQCPNGHKINITWCEFRRGIRCPICSGLKKKTIKEVKKYINSFGYKCLSNKYVNWKTELEIQCPNGHKYKTKWATFQQGARCPECNKIKTSINKSGPNCNFWRGGISNEPYCSVWIPEFKKMIKERDRNKCLNPVCENGNYLTVHHIDYNKKKCNKENLITLCRSCNSKANFNRRWHEHWYKAILFRRYNYVYGV